MDRGRGVQAAAHGWIVPVLGGEQWGGHHSATSGFSSSPGYRKARLSRLQSPWLTEASRRVASQLVATVVKIRMRIASASAGWSRNRRVAARIARRLAQPLGLAHGRTHKGALEQLAKIQGVTHCPAN